jgi:hypothetical protein
LREVLIFFVFLLITALMTWPWVRYLRDAVADNGDSYAFVWSLWWNFHQTFRDPINLFHANIFYPYRYTLAFTEHGYGVAMLFFPLLAIGLRPLTVYSIATFVSFAASGYGAFRLVRTLTGSNGAGFVGGIFFAFVPYHFMFITALPYLWTAWLPLLVESLVLFARLRSWPRAMWLSVTFLLTGLSCVNWFFLSLIPFVLTWPLLAVRLRIERERAFWCRGIIALGVASLLLLPFLWPYYKANRIYGFRRDITEVTQSSGSFVDWLFAPGYNKLWDGLGRGLPGAQATLFPGLLTFLLFLAAIFLATKSRRKSGTLNREAPITEWSKIAIQALDGTCVIALGIATLASGFGSSTADLALVLLGVALLIRLSIAYPQILNRRETGNLLESLRSERRDDAFWVGLLWAGFGFICAFGTKTFLYRVVYEWLIPFQSLRAPTRAGMICYVGLAILAGIGATRLAQITAHWQGSIRTWMVYSILVAGLLFELHAAPMPLIHGASVPDAVTQQLKSMPIRGGVVELPSMPQPPYYSWHLSMLRATDHAHPVVFAASSFTPYLTVRVHDLASGPNMSTELLDLLEEIPVSYVVIRWQLVSAERQPIFGKFLADARESGRMKLLGTYDGDELYAVTKTEAEVR